MYSKEKIQEQAEKLLTVFQEDNLPVLARAVFRSKNNKPCEKWSFNNYLLMLLSGTNDARGIRQWNSVNRKVKAGCHAFYILAPSMVKISKDIEKTDPETGKVEIEHKRFEHLNGFLGVPVFRFEDTEGEPLPIDDFNFTVPARFEELVQKLNLKIECTPFENGYYGTFYHKENRITLSTPEIKTFFHEIAHAVDQVLNGTLKPGQDPEQETVAEMSGAVIGTLLGYETSLGNSKEYIKSYNSGEIKAVYRLLDRIGKVCKYILDNTVQAFGQAETITPEPVEVPAPVPCFA